MIHNPDREADLVEEGRLNHLEYLEQADRRLERAKKSLKHRLKMYKQFKKRYNL